MTNLSEDVNSLQRKFVDRFKDHISCNIAQELSFIKLLIMNECTSIAQTGSLPKDIFTVDTPGLNISSFFFFK